MALKFNSDADLQDVVSELNDICNADNNSFPLKSKARKVNFALDKFYSLAFQSQGNWAWDDPSRDTVPIETINLVANTQSYNIGTFTSEVLNILRVEALDSAGNSITLKRLDRADLPETALPAYQPTAGTPYEYDLVGEYIHLYPKPNYSSTNGLRFYINRPRVAFASTDTTKTLPVPSIFEKYICNLGALQYLIEHQKPQRAEIAALVARDEAEIPKYFANRGKERKRATMWIGRFR